MSLFTKLMSVDHLMMAAAAAHPEAPPALPMIDLCGCHTESFDRVRAGSSVGTAR